MKVLKTRAFGDNRLYPSDALLSHYIEVLNLWRKDFFRANKDVFCSKN